MHWKPAIMLTVLVGAVLLATGMQNEASSTKLYVIKVNGKYGFIDGSGKTVITPAYDEAFPFQEGLSGVKVGNKYGFIDSSGRFVVQPKFADIFSFSEGLAAVKVGNKWGYIDLSGKLVIAPQFKHGDVFAEGLAGFDLEHQYGCIDKAGKIVFKFEGLGLVYKFSEGLAAVTAIGSPKSKTFFVDRTGKQAFPGEFDSAGRFSEGLAAVTKDDQNAFIDKTGKAVIPFSSSWGPWGWFSEGLEVVFLHQGGAAYMDKTGKTVIAGSFNRAEPFAEGLAAVQIRIGEDMATTVKTKDATIMSLKAGMKYGYIDKSGAMVIPAQFESADEFVNGLARVCLESTATFDPVGQKRPCGYIDKTGKMVWQPSQ